MSATTPMIQGLLRYWTQRDYVGEITVWASFVDWGYLDTQIDYDVGVCMVIECWEIEM